MDELERIKYQALPFRLYVSTHKRRMGFFKIPIWNFKLGRSFNLQGRNPIGFIQPKDDDKS